MVERNKLLRAVLNKNLSRVRDCILVDGEDLYYRDEKGRSYLHLAACLKDANMVAFLLDEGLDPNDTDEDLITPLHRACRVGSLEVVKLLQMYGAKLNAQARNGITPLHVATANLNLDVLEFLLSKLEILEEEENIFLCDKEGHTALHYACNDGCLDVVEILLKHRFRVDERNIAGNTPLHFAAVSNQMRTVDALIRADDLDFRHLLNAQNLLGQTPLHIATLADYTDGVVRLLSHGADSNVQDADGNTCSHLALKNGHIPLIHFLLSDRRMDSSICDNEENTVLHLALKLGHTNLIPKLIEKASDLSKQDANGCSVIIEAIRGQLEELAVKMLDACPSLAHTATNELVTPLHLAAERGMTTLTKKLLIAGAQVDAADASGLTPSLYCAKNDSVLECLAMIEDLMMVTDNNTVNDHTREQVKGNSSKISSKISV